LRHRGRVDSRLDLGLKTANLGRQLVVTGRTRGRRQVGRHRQNVVHPISGLSFGNLAPRIFNDTKCADGIANSRSPAARETTSAARKMPIDFLLRSKSFNTGYAAWREMTGEPRAVKDG
jgi:hypothetical protein